MSFRKVAVASVATIALLGAVPRALAGSGSGTIKVGHAGTLMRGTTEAEFRAGDCKSLPTTQGTDGWVIDLGGHTRLDLTTDSPLPRNIVVLFYSAGCARVGPLYGGQNSTSYSGTIPTLNGVPAKWAVVNAVYGANIAVNYTVSTPT